MAVTNFSGKNLVPPQMGLRSYAHAVERCVQYAKKPRRIRLHFT